MAKPIQKLILQHWSGAEVKFILDLKDLAEECFAAYPFEVTINAQLLIFTMVEFLPP